jgi:trk system potassium uptake protein TrkH
LNFRHILLVNGLILEILAAFMLIPGLYALWLKEGLWTSFAISSGATSFFGLLLIVSVHPHQKKYDNIHDNFILIVTLWFLSIIFSSLCLYLSPLSLSMIDALFETISGLTTTGASIFPYPDRLSPAILLWRALLQWLGGIAVMISALTLLPAMRIGGMELFQTTASLPSAPSGFFSDKKLIRDKIYRLIGLYVSLTFFITLALCCAGMTGLEGICHAMSSLSTGGFSTSSQSLAHFSNSAQWICMIAMLLGALSFLPLIKSQDWQNWQRWPFILSQDSQTRVLILLILVFSGFMTLWTWLKLDIPLTESLRLAGFNVISIVTSTGFHNADYSQWGGFAQQVFFILSLIGGCSRSASGGVKIFRYEVMFAATLMHIHRLIHPREVFHLFFNKILLSPLLIRSVMGFIILYFLCFSGLAFALALSGLDPVSAISGAASSLGNVGPALGTVIGPMGHFNDLSSPTKILLACGMLLGRLEIAPLLVLFSFFFWKDR